MLRFRHNCVKKFKANELVFFFIFARHSTMIQSKLFWTFCYAWPKIWKRTMKKYHFILRVFPGNFFGASAKCLEKDVWRPIMSFKCPTNLLDGDSALKNYQILFNEDNLNSFIFRFIGKYSTKFSALVGKFPWRMTWLLGRRALES